MYDVHYLTFPSGLYGAVKRSTISGTTTFPVHGQAYPSCHPHLAINGIGDDIHNDKRPINNGFCSLQSDTQPWIQVEFNSTLAVAVVSHSFRYPVVSVRARINSHFLVLVRPLVSFSFLFAISKCTLLLQCVFDLLRHQRYLP